MNIRKLILFASLGIIIYSMCACYSETDSIREKNVKDTNGAWANIKKYEYEGHKYIKFSNVRQAAVTHDPNCPCYNTY